MGSVCDDYMIYIRWYMQCVRLYSLCYSARTYTTENGWVRKYRFEYVEEMKQRLNRVLEIFKFRIIFAKYEYYRRTYIEQDHKHLIYLYSLINENAKQC